MGLDRARPHGRLRHLPRLLLKEYRFDQDGIGRSHGRRVGDHTS
jgi:hypothetical protein